MQRAPFLRIVEDAVCREYYEGVAPKEIDLSLPIPEEDCKIAPVQSELAWLKGIDMTVSCIPGILTSVPYGYIADKYGRKLVLISALFGIILNLCWVVTVGYFSDVMNIRWFWAGNALLLIGGGSGMVKAMIFAMLADVASEDKRAGVFFQFMAACLISTVIGVPFAWRLMKINAWIPMILGIGFIFMGTLLCFFLPETLERSTVPEPTPDSGSEEDIHEVQQPTFLHRYSRKKKISKMFEKMKASHFIFKSPMLLGLSITFLLQSLGGQMTSFMFQLASERFHWPLGDASFLIPIGAVTNFIVLVVVLPAIYHILSHRFHLRSMVKDLIVARGSLMFLVIGALGMAWGPVPTLFILAVILFAFGSGFSSSTRSLVTSLVHPDEVSRLYAVMSVVDTLGIMMYGPILSKTYGWGLDLAGPWTGMAFIAIAVMYGVLGLPVWLVTAPTPEMDIHG